MKLLVDMNLSPRWVDLLAKSGFSARHWSDVGPSGASDREIMAWAGINGYVVLTHDLDFGDILAATQGAKPSVAQIRSENVDPAAIGAHVISALLQMEPELESGALLTIDPTRARVRLLPLASRT